MTDEPTESINLTIRIESITNGYLVSCDGSKATRDDPLAQFSVGRDPAYRATLDEVKRDVDWLIGLNHGRAKELRERREAQEQSWNERYAEAGVPGFEHHAAADPHFERASPWSRYHGRAGPPITSDPTFAMRSGPVPTMLGRIIEELEPAPTDPTVPRTDRAPWIDPREPNRNIASATLRRAQEIWRNEWCSWAIALDRAYQEASYGTAEPVDLIPEGEGSPLSPGEETIPEWIEPEEKKGDNDNEPI